MSYLLDTCVLSEYVKKKPSPVVIEWLNSQAEDDLFLSVLTIGELKRGIFKLELTQPVKFTRLSDWVKKLELRFEGRILLIDMAVVNQWSKLCSQSEAKGKKLPIMDSLIAATAKAYNLTVVTRNVDDFYFASVDLFNPWDIEST
ncbi:type II toxin-antitoxin system VapC family toxin [Spirulina subsalsa FACHB-351]|uniref:Type II toxin-antitoxin system VapC family toxin n=1 Tax=Spirulina subsalsa FACHB-351 TaxID=234711 RepID=A0ABT3LBE1_9CYAN|nr:type II toxin-antitoxin system VapC family toxin [Spirulina subsalsa]MCW6038825.1 type II toxin-antitoxin system VapC family toxin [Spirulina subsalsa FACHB-351]